MIIEWCRQAESRNIFIGDLHPCQTVGKNIAAINNIVLDRDVRQSLYKKIDSVVELWMAVEHRDLYAKKKEAEERRKEEEETYVDLTAASMTEMLQKVKRLTSIDSDRS